MPNHFHLPCKSPLVTLLALLPATGVLAQTSAGAPTNDGAAAPVAMTTPSMSGPLTANPNPLHFDAGALGTWYVTGAVTGLGLYQNHRSPSDKSSRADLSNGQIFIQKNSGQLQFFVQVGSYSMPSLGTAYLPAHKTDNAYFGAVPQAFIKYVPSDRFNIMAGKLPTLIGAEYTFTFQNMNIQRGLLWNQENAVNTGVQANYTSGPVTASLSVNDGFYSHRYHWVTGLLTYAFDKNHTLTFAGGGNTGTTRHVSTATPLLQNNGSIYNLIYSHLAGPWTITPYLQYSQVPSSHRLDIPRSASTLGAAVLASYVFNSNFSLAGRAEYIDSSGRAASATPSLLYGPGSHAWSLTLTPTYQNKLLFVRAEVAYVKATNTTPGYAFGRNFDTSSQSRVMLETGLLF